MKPRPDLIPAVALLRVGAVMAHGVDKHAGRTWTPDEHYAALMRHAWRWRAGETIDPDSGLPHVAMVAARALMLVDLLEPKKAPPFIGTTHPHQENA